MAPRGWPVPRSSSSCGWGGWGLLGQPPQGCGAGAVGLAGSKGNVPGVPWGPPPAWPGEVGPQQHLWAPRSAAASLPWAPPPGLIYGADSAAQLRALVPGRERGGWERFVLSVANVSQTPSNSREILQTAQDTESLPPGLSGGSSGGSCALQTARPAHERGHGP